MKIRNHLLLLFVFIFTLLSFTQFVNAQTYDCTNPWYNDDRITGCENCGTRCAGSLTYNSCLNWCEGNNFCNGCTPCKFGATRDQSTGNCICQDDSCCRNIFRDAIWDGNLTDGCICMPGATVQDGKCICGLDYTANPQQRTCICGDDGCCQRIFGASHFSYNATDGCECDTNTSWNGSKCVAQIQPTQITSSGCYCNGRKLTVLEMLDTVDGECPPCPDDNNTKPSPTSQPNFTPTPPDGRCINGKKDDGEEGIDCGGICEAECEWSMSISPREIEMTADGVSKQEFTVRIIKGGLGSVGESITLEINDINQMLSSDKKGILKPSSGQTDENGEFKFTYQTQEQYIDFEGAEIYLNINHDIDDAQVKINLTKSVNVQCGNWVCEERETNANCPQDCARDITYQQALDEIQTRYRRNIKLNPYYPEGTASFQLYFTGMRNNFPKGIADGYLWLFEKLEAGGGWIGEKLNLGELDLSSIKKPYDKISQQYDPYTCGSFQTKITHMLNSMKWSNDATERKIISYFDYSPVTTNIPAHEAVMIYPNGTDWKDTALVLDPWLMNNHNAYPISVWSGWGITAGVACNQHPDYPACGKDYQIPNAMRNDLNAKEKEFYNSLNSEMKRRIDASLAYIQRYVDLFNSQRNYELAAKYKDELNNHKSYIIQELMYSDRFNKVEIIIDCPVRVLITDNLTGKKVGIDKDGNLINEIPRLLPDLRLLGDSDIYSYFTLPKDGDYKIEMFGTQSGQAEVYKSVPTSDGKFETYTYSDIPVSNDSTMNLDFSLSKKGEEIKADGKIYKAEKNIVDAKLDSLDTTLDFILGISKTNPDKCIDGEGLGIWGILIMLLGFGILGGGVISFLIINRNKKAKIIAIIVLISGVCIGCTLNTITITSWILDDGGTCPENSTNFIDNGSSNFDTQDDSDFDADASNIADVEVMGFVENQEYNFSLFVGEFAPDLEIKNENPDWAKATYHYCIKLTNTQFEDINCGQGKYGLFNITVFDNQQYQNEVTESPLGDVYTTLYSRNNLNIVFSHPNGDPPEGLVLPDDFYKDVTDSFVKLDDTNDTKPEDTNKTGAVG